MHATVCTIDPKTGNASVMPVEVAETTTVADLLSELELNRETAVAIYTRKVTPETKISEGDRIDIGTPLNIDPKSIRKIRAMNPRFTSKGVLARHGGKHQLERSPAAFPTRKRGVKAGYN